MLCYGLFNCVYDFKCIIITGIGMKFCNISIDVAAKESLNKGAVDLFCDLKPDWIREEVKIQHLEGGTTNKIVLGWFKDDNDKILIRYCSINCISL